MDLFRLVKHRLVKDSLILYGVQITGYILPFVTQPYLARVLGPANIGLIGLGTALTLYFASVVEYGFAVTGPRQIAIAQDTPEEVSRVYSTILACRVMLMGLSAAVLVILVSTVPRYRSQWALYAVCFLQVVGWCLSPNWLLQGLQRMRFVAYADYGAKVVFVLLIFLLVRRRQDYIPAAALQSGGFLVAAAIGLTIVFGLLRVRLVRPTWNGMLGEMRTGWPVFLSMASVTVVASTNIMILGSLASNASVGYMSAAMRLVVAMRALANPISSAIYPHLSKLAARSPLQGLQFMRRVFVWVVLPFSAVSVFLIFFAPLVVRILYGREFAESGVLLRLMAFTPCLYAAGMCVSNYMLAFGFEKAWSKIILQMTVLNFVVLGALLLVMEPARAVALTTVLVDAGSLASYLFFYRRTAGPRLAAESA